jgi:multisubunit Na+/H+ antiporter MnhB subunit
MPIIAAVLVIYGLASIAGKVKVFPERRKQVYLGIGLVVASIALLFLTAAFPHG